MIDKLLSVIDGRINVEQHSSESIGFKETTQCPNALYQLLRWYGLRCIDKSNQYINYADVEVRKVVYEDGVISIDMSHPHVIHEDELDGYSM